MAEPAGMEPAGSGPPAPTLSDLVFYRRATEEDMGFIRKNWLRITRQVVKGVPSDVFYEEHDQLIGMLADLPTTQAWVAADKSYPFYIYGWVVGEPCEDGEAIVHFVFVRDEWRKRGIARGLLSQLGYRAGAAMHVTHWSDFLKPTKLTGKTIIKNPYLLRRAYEHAAAKTQVRSV